MRDCFWPESKSCVPDPVWLCIGACISGGTVFGTGGPIMTAKISPGRPILAANIGQGDPAFFSKIGPVGPLLGADDFCVTGLLVSRGQTAIFTGVYR